MFFQSPVARAFVRFTLAESLVGYMLMPARAQYPFDVWRTEDRRPQNSIYAFLQTRYGYPFATTFNSLVRYDGVHFQLFRRGLLTIHASGESE